MMADQNGDLVGHMSFQENKIICSPAGSLYIVFLGKTLYSHNASLHQGEKEQEDW